MTNKNTNNVSSDTLHRVPLYRRPIFIVGLSVIVIVVIIAAIVLLVRNPDSQHEQPSDSPDESTSTTLQEGSSLPESEEDASEPAGVPQYEGEDPNTLPELTGSIAYRGVDQDSDLLTIGVSIDQYLQSSGKCTLRLLLDDREVYSAEQPAVADVTTSVCDTFEVPLSSLDSGSYKIEITVSADDKTGLITDEIDI